ncbi:MAG: ABC transporter substrate-binding protein [Alphaproteobacteria bacterium]|nr:MAG: ABC transporter substrate-binding protein [Alphaproteobacteria bacterium]
MPSLLKSARRTGLSIMALAAAMALAVAPAGAETRFKISIDSGPAHINNITLRTFLDKLKETTGGELVGELAEGGSLYAARDEARAVARGDVEMSLTATAWLSSYYSDLAVVDLPLFAGLSPEAINGVIDGEVGKELAEGFASKLGVVVPGRWYLLGFGTTFGAGKPIRSFADYNGARIRVPGSAAYIERYRVLGAEGLSIPFPDVPLAISQGTIDGLMTTNETVASFRLHETGLKTALMDQSAVLYFVPLVSPSFWDKIGDDNRKAFVDAWESLVDGQRAEAVKRQAAAQVQNEKNGIETFIPSAEELAAVNAKLAQAIPGIAEQLKIAPELLAIAQKAVADAPR